MYFFFTPSGKWSNLTKHSVPNRSPKTTKKPYNACRFQFLKVYGPRVFQQVQWAVTKPPKNVSFERLLRDEKPAKSLSISVRVEFHQQETWNSKEPVWKMDVVSWCPTHFPKRKDVEWSNWKPTIKKIVVWGKKGRCFLCHFQLCTLVFPRPIWCGTSGSSPFEDGWEAPGIMLDFLLGIPKKSLGKLYIYTYMNGWF